MPTIIASILSIVSSVIGGISAEQQAKLALLLQENQDLTELLKGQEATNTAEATSPSLFVAGWRPFVGWVCASAFAWQFVAIPILTFAAAAAGHPIEVPHFDISTMSTVLMGMLGLGGLRTYEKVQGVSNRH